MDSVSMPALLARIAALMPVPGLPVGPAAEAIPEAKGAYALAMRLDRPVPVLLRGATAGLGPGWFVYAGSARGPGGLRGRLMRHFRRDKALHWHVDRLTSSAAEIGAVAFTDATECGIVARLGRSGAFDIPLEGFGSSDCRTCRAHLLRVLRPASLSSPSP